MRSTWYTRCTRARRQAKQLTNEWLAGQVGPPEFALFVGRSWAERGGRGASSPVIAAEGREGVDCGHAAPCAPGGERWAAGPLGRRARLLASVICWTFTTLGAPPLRGRGRGTRPRLTRARLRRPLCRPAHPEPPPRPWRPRRPPATLCAVPAVPTWRRRTWPEWQRTAALHCRAVPLAGGEEMLPAHRAAPPRSHAP